MNLTPSALHLRSLASHEYLRQKDFWYASTTILPVFTFSHFRRHFREQKREVFLRPLSVHGLTVFEQCGLAHGRLRLGRLTPDSARILASSSLALDLRT